ncbi:MAG: hypothetical protein U0K71_04205 [Paludibacteraceae bacterium]|nr:hypothetical protein [Paludibacteraceae bacterium]
MKKFLLYVAMFATNFFFVSCDKDNEENDAPVESVENKTEPQYQYEISILTTTTTDPYRPEKAKTSTSTAQFESRKEAEDYIANLRQEAQNKNYVIESQYSWYHKTYGFASYIDTKVQIEIYHL